MTKLDLDLEIFLSSIEKKIQNVIFSTRLKRHSEKQANNNKQF